jgi:hypothetical protein
MPTEELLTPSTEVVDSGASADVEASPAEDIDIGTGEEEVEIPDTEHVEEKPETEEHPDGEEEPPEDKEEAELKEFGGLVSARLRGMVKIAPELAQVFKKYPQVQAMWEKMARRESALSEIWPTIAEARQMREQFPNGQADVQELINDSKEVDELDKAFDAPGEEGDYPGHADLIKDWVGRNKDASIALFKRLPKEWAQIDRESYNDVMGKVVAATLSNGRIPETLQSILDYAKENDDKALVKTVTNLLGWANSFYADKPAPTQEQKELQRERAELNRTKQETSKQENSRFYAQFISTSKKVQNDIISAHPAIKRLASIKALEGKKDSIVDQIRKQIDQLLGKSPSFMNKLRPLYAQRNMDEIMKLTKAAFSTPWLLNRAVRTVLRKEVPQIVSNNREAVRRRAGAPPAKRPVQQPGDKKQAQPTGPFKGPDGLWHNKDGSRMSAVDVLAGRHLQI